MVDDAADGAAAYESPKETSGDKRKLVSFWLRCVALASDEEKAWREKCEHIADIYRGRATTTQKASAAGAKISFNILRSNVRTLRPNLYNSTPTPDVRRRFGDKDALSKFAGDLLERVVSIGLDDGEFDRVMLGSVQDMLLFGRGVPWVRLDGVVTDDAHVQSASVRYELVPWDDFRRSSGRSWSDVWWVGRRHLMRRDDIRRLNKKAGNEIKLEYSIAGKSKSDDDKDSEVYKRAEVWEIWDRDTKRVLWIAPSWRDEPLLAADDPLRLQEFFPCPEPLYDDCDTTSLVPVPDFVSYENQARELEAVTQRIRGLLSVLKWRGAYDNTLSEISQVMTAEDGVLVPVANAAAMMQSGGMERAIWLMPLDKAIVVLRELYASREQIKQVIYEITGIADIQRGASDPNETLGAQQLKAQWGSGRLQERQRAVQRLARDLIRMTVEIMAEHVPQDLLLEMAGMEIPAPVMPQPQPQMQPQMQPPAVMQ